MELSHSNLSIKAGPYQWIRPFACKTQFNEPTHGQRNTTTYETWQFIKLQEYNNLSIQIIVILNIVSLKTYITFVCRDFARVSAKFQPPRAFCRNKGNICFYRHLSLY